MIKNEYETDIYLITSDLNLYYINNPNKVFHYEEKRSVFSILFYIIPFALGIIVIKLLGFNLQ